MNYNNLHANHKNSTHLDFLESRSQPNSQESRSNNLQMFFQKYRTAYNPVLKLLYIFLLFSVVSTPRRKYPTKKDVTDSEKKMRSMLFKWGSHNQCTEEDKETEEVCQNEDNSDDETQTESEKKQNKNMKNKKKKTESKKAKKIENNKKTKKNENKKSKTIKNKKQKKKSKAKTREEKLAEAEEMLDNALENGNEDEVNKIMKNMENINDDKDGHENHENMKKKRKLAENKAESEPLKKKRKLQKIQNDDQDGNMMQEILKKERQLAGNEAENKHVKKKKKLKHIEDEEVENKSLNKKKLKRKIDNDEGESSRPKKKRKIQNVDQECNPQKKKKNVKQKNFFEKVTNKQIKKWEKKFPVFEFDQENAKMRCRTCHKANSTSEFAKWCDISKKLGDRIRDHCGVDNAGNELLNRGKKHRDSKKKLEYFQNKKENDTKGKKKIIEPLQKVTREELKERERQAKSLLRIVMMICENGMPISTFFDIREMIRVLLTDLEKAKDSEIYQLRNLLISLKDNIDKVQDLELKHVLLDNFKKLKNQLLVILKNYSIKVSDVPQRVSNGAAVNDLIRVLSSDLWNRRLEDIKNSPVFSIMIDESTDNAKKEQLTINVIYVKNGERIFSFLGLVPISSLQAEDIKVVLIDFLKKCGLDFSRWMSFGSDGASVMRGSNNGVVALLKNFLTHHFIAFHCVAHITALSAKAGAISSSLAHLADALIRVIASDFSKSTKKNAKFEELQKTFNQEKGENLNSVLRLVPFHEIRWLSRQSTVTRILRLLEQLFRFYKMLYDQDQNPRYLHLCSYKIIKFLHIVLDILGPLTKITRMSQSNDLDIVGMRDILTQEIENLKSLKNSQGDYETQFEEKLEVSQDENGNTVYKIYGHTLKYRERDFSEIENAKNMYIQTVVDDITDRFQGFNESLLSLSFLFNLRTLRDSEISPNVEALAKVYPERIDVEAFVLEIRQIKLELETKAKKKIFKKFSELAKWILNLEKSYKYPQLYFFLSLILTLPFCTAECERTFSAMNYIKNKYRNRLKTILNDCLIMYTACKPEIEAVDIDKAAKKVAHVIWKKKSTESKPWSEAYNWSMI